MATKLYGDTTDYTAAGTLAGTNTLLLNQAGTIVYASLSTILVDLDILTTSDIGTTVQAYDADLASWASVTRASGFDTWAATPSSANLASLVTGETGSGALVFGTSPGFTTAANPASDDGATLGTTSLKWSDLFLSSGGAIDWNNGNVTLTHSSGIATFNSRIATTQSSGGYSNAQIHLNVGSTGNPTIRWKDQSGLTGLRFYSEYGGGTEIARFQDNGSCYFSTIGTLGGFEFFNYGFKRGSNGGRLDIGYGSPTFDLYSQSDASTTALCRIRGITTTVPVLRVKAAASHSSYVQDWVNSSDTVMAGVRKNGAFKPASLADSAAENDSVYYSTDASKLVYKDSGGTVNNLY